jgi:hypothetical protein
MTVRNEIYEILRDLRYGVTPVSLEDTMKKLEDYIPAIRAGMMINSDWGWCALCGAVRVNASEGFDICASCVEGG